MISKELLSKIWGNEVTSIEKITTMWDMRVLPFWVKEPSRVNGFNDKKYHISVETIAHKCKEWAFKQGYVIGSGIFFDFESNQEYFCNVAIANILTWKRFTESTEPEAIIKACEWIMEQTKGE